MKIKPDLYANIDDEGRLVLPQGINNRLGLVPGSFVPVTELAHGLTIRLPATLLKKVYIEPSTHCNLSCKTCIRNTWDEPMGHMSEDVFKKIIEGLKAFSPKPSVVFGGFGEPLLNPNIVHMVSEVKKAGCRAELISNGILLNKDLTRDLIKARLDFLWISLDGATDKNYGYIRRGGLLDTVVENVSVFRDSRQAYRSEIGIVFVAMKHNISELPSVVELGKKLGAVRFLVTNVLPYTQEMYEEVLYTCRPDSADYTPSSSTPGITICKMEVNENTKESIFRIMNSLNITASSGFNREELNNYCPFVENGSTAICWDGSVSPCLPLMHSHVSFFHNKKRFNRRYIVGSIEEKSLDALWNEKQYTYLRRKVQSFSFASCVFCEGCDMAETNEVDCARGGFPACGGCIWAQGFIRCP